MATKIITTEEKNRREMSKLYEKAKNKVWEYKLEDFKLDEKFNFTHKDWHGVYCKGGNSAAETVALINEYIASASKPYGERQLDWLHLVNE